MGLLKIFSGLIGLGGGNKRRRIDINKASAATGLNIIYGTRRVEPVPIYKAVSKNNMGQAVNNADAEIRHTGNANKYDEVRKGKDWLYRVDVWGQGLVSSIDKVLIDDDHTGHSRWNKRPFYRGLHYYGKEDATYCSAIPGGEWTSAHAGKGVAYTVSRFYNSKDKPQFNAEPKLEAIIKGLACYDPRKDSAYTAHMAAAGYTQSSTAHDASDETTWEYSVNRALVVLNYLMASYGQNAPLVSINMESFIDAAEKCDAPMDVHNPVTNTTGQSQMAYNRFLGKYDLIDIDEIWPGNIDEVINNPTRTIPRHTVDAVLDPKNSVVENIKTLLEGFGWSMPWSNGQYKLIIDDVAAPVMAFDADSIISVGTITRGNRNKRLNQVTVEYANRKSEYKDDTVTWPEKDSAFHTTFLVEDQGEALHESVTAETITQYNRALAWAEYLVRKSRVDMSIKGMVLSAKAALLEPGDVITIDHADKALSAHPFIVDKVSIDGWLKVTVDLVEYNASVYDVNAPFIGPVLSFDDLAENLKEPTAINGLQAVAFHNANTDGTAISGFELSWDDIVDTISVDYIEISWKETSSDPQNDPTFYSEIKRIEKDATTAKLSGLLDSESYDIRVNYRTQLGQVSAEAEILGAVLGAAGTIIEAGTVGGAPAADIVDRVITDPIVFVSGGKAFTHRWGFLPDLMGWTGSASAAITHNTSPPAQSNGPTLNLVSINTDPYIQEAGLSIVGATNTIVRVRLHCNTTVTGTLTIFYSTSSHGYSSSFSKGLPARTYAAGKWYTLFFDMADLSVGGTDWVDNIITGLRFDVAQSMGQDWDIDGIVVGYYDTPDQTQNILDEAGISDGADVTDYTSPLVANDSATILYSSGAMSAPVPASTNFAGGSQHTFTVPATNDKGWVHALVTDAENGVRMGFSDADFNVLGGLNNETRWYSFPVTFPLAGSEVLSIWATNSDGATLRAVVVTKAGPGDPQAITDASDAALTADWGGVTGTGRPADGATVGATWGNNITSQPADKFLLNNLQEWDEVQDAFGFKPANNADVTDYADGRVSNDNEASGSNLFLNEGFKLLAADGRPVGVRASYSNITPSTIQAIPGGGVRLFSATDNAIGMSFQAFRVNKNSKYQVTVRAKADADYANGFHIWFHNYSGELAGVQKYVRQIGGNNAEDETIMIESNISTSVMRSNGNITSAYVDYTDVVTPTAGTKWSSLTILNWDGMGLSPLDVESVSITEIQPESVADMDYTGELDADKTSGKLAGRGTNMLPSEYAGEMKGGVVTSNATISYVADPDPTGSIIDPAVPVMEIAASATNSWVFFALSTSRYNMDKVADKHIVSAWVRCTTQAGAVVRPYLRYGNGIYDTDTSTITLGAQNNWERISFVADLANNSNDMLFRFDIDTICTVQITKIMIEEALGDVTTPSAYVAPSDLTYNSTANDTKFVHGTAAYLAAGSSNDFMADNFEYANKADMEDNWTFVVGTGEVVARLSSNATGGKAVSFGNDNDADSDDSVTILGKNPIPIDRDALYEVGFRIYVPTGGEQFVYFGVAGYNTDGDLVNAIGVSGAGSQHYFAALFAATVAGWQEYRGYFKGSASSGNGGYHPDPADPGTMHAAATRAAPIAYVNYNGPGETWMDKCWIRKVGEVEKRAADALTFEGHLRPTTGYTQVSGAVRKFATGPKVYQLRDGDVINYANNYDTVPSVWFSNGGLTEDTGTLSGGAQNQYQKFAASSSAVSGFTADLKLSEKAASPVLQASSVTGTGTGIDKVINKNIAAEAFDDQYTFVFDVSVTNIFQGFSESWSNEWVDIDILTKEDTGSFVVRDTVRVQSEGLSPRETFSNISSTVTVNSLNTPNDKFGISISNESYPGAGTIDSFDKVNFYTATGAPATVGATPTEISPIQVLVFEGKEV